MDNRTRPFGGLTQWRGYAMATLACTLLSVSHAAPSQNPLLIGASGAKPNLMIALDNSGSMAFNFHETYGVTSDDEYERRYCPSPYSNNTSTSGRDGEAFYDAANDRYRCYRRSGGNWYTIYTVSLPYVPARSTNKWSAQRSADVNPLYYNPRTTYFPRVDSNGNPLVPADNIAFISNQNSAAFQYQVFRNGTTDDIRTHHSMYASNPDVSGYTRIYNIAYSYRTPQHITYRANQITASTPGFTYAICPNVVSSGGLQTDCEADGLQRITVTGTSTAAINLPSDHKRVDCSGNTCTAAQERANIMNWFRYYAFRAPAVATAIGQSLANTEYEKKLRLGYISINRRNGSSLSAINQTPGVTTDNQELLRGVRRFEMGSATANQIYTWLYDQDGTQNRTSNRGADGTFSSDVNRRHAPYSGTPLHNVVNRVARYYSVPTGARENPWTTDPSQMDGPNNPELNCRRSFNLLFSDGAWNSGTANFEDAGFLGTGDYDNIVGPLFTRANSTQTYRYRPTGGTTAAQRKDYVPYPSSATNGLADLTAGYFWHKDLRTALGNNIQTRAGQPAFWQNMTTYTVGYLIRPSGEVPGATSGLTFSQITNYQKQFAEVGYAAATKPSWVTGDVNSSGSDQNRVDDFIQAGFTGGGRGFSASTADDVRDIFDIVLSDILNSQGRDAGIAVSSNGGDTSTLAGKYKYKVTYRTLDNSGDVIAEELDENALEVGTAWKASETIGAHDTRRVFSITGQSTGVEFKGSFSALDSDIKAALATGPDASKIPTNSDFVDYLRGKDPVADTDGNLFRQRDSKLGAMVNPPSVYIGGGRDFAYDLRDDAGTQVSGAGSYKDYVQTKIDLPASLYVATNAGVVHALKADDGEELAAFMPRNSLKRMLRYASPSYSFEYVLDGPLSEHDIYREADDRWDHMITGTGGRGERLIYALRAPLNTGATPNRIPEKEDFRWELSPDDVNTASLTMGYITHPGRSGQTLNGEWVVVYNTGHHNEVPDGKQHGLIVLNALTGDVIRTIPLPGSYDAGRGLSGVTLARNADGRIAAAYAGDANGQLWRFDLSGAPSTWKVSYGQPLFTTPGNRPIYGAPAWQVNKRNGGTTVVIATGMLLDDADTADVTTNWIYGINDPTDVGQPEVLPFVARTVSDLLLQSFTSSTATDASGNNYFQITENKYDPDIHKGWRLALDRRAGERNIDQVRNLGTNVLINTTVITPVDPDEEMCTLSNLPPNYIYNLNAITGAGGRGFDVDGNKTLDPYSVVEAVGGGYSRGLKAIETYPSSQRMEPDHRLRYSADEDAGEANPSAKCRGRKVTLVGTEAGGLSAGVACESGWNRSQYQLSRPPL